MHIMGVDFADEPSFLFPITIQQIAGSGQELKFQPLYANNHILAKEILLKADEGADCRMLSVPVHSSSKRDRTCDNRKVLRSHHTSLLPDQPIDILFGQLRQLLKQMIHDSI